MSWNILPKNVLQYFLEKIKSKFMLIWNHDILGAKNILPFPYTYGSGTSYGLTITVHEDGSITAQGTPTQNIMFLINDNIIKNLSLWQGSEMIFSEWEVQNQNAFAALLLGQSTPISEVRGDYKLTVTSEMIQQGVAFILYFGNGVDLTTPITFKPMIRLATDPDHTWRSPALTNKQLTDSVFYLSYAKSHVSANPSTTTGVLNGLEIDGTAYEIQGTGEPNVQADWNEVDSTADDYIKNKPSKLSDFTNDITSIKEYAGARVFRSGYSTADMSQSDAINIAAWDATTEGEARLRAVKQADLKVAYAASAGSATDSTKVAKSGDTMSGTLYFSNYNDVAICLNSSGPNYKTTISHQSAGQEATVIATKFENTSLIFINGEDSLTNHTNNRWQSLVPGLQVKKNCVAIGKLIGQGVDPSYKLEVNGTTKSTTFDGNLKYAHTNEINFGGGNQATCYFNYRNADTEQAAAVSSIAYKFCNYSNDTSKSNILAGYFNGYTIGKSVPSNAVFSDANVAQTNTTGNAAYRVLYSVNADDADRVEGARKGRIYFNPSNGMFWASNGTNQFQIGNNYLYLNGKITLIQAGNQQLTISATTSASGETNYRVALGVYNNAWTFKPFTDKSLTLGQSSERWGQIYSSNSAISTSDRKEKKDIVSLDEFARTLIMSLNPVSYKFKDGNSGRTHYGMIAQDVEDSLEELGITAIDIAAFCKDKKLKDIPVFSGQRDSKGNPIYDKKQVPIPGEYTYGLRYEEFIAPIIKTEQLQQEDINSLKEEISLLKEEIALLKHRIDILEGK